MKNYNQKKIYRYEVYGYVVKNGEKHKEVCKTNSIQIDEEYLRYQKSDGTEVVIHKPYVIIDYNFNKPFKKIN